MPRKKKGNSSSSNPIMSDEEFLHIYGRPRRTFKIPFPAASEPVQLNRRAMPTIIEHEIVGVSPMTAPVPGFWDLVNRERSKK